MIVTLADDNDPTSENTTETSAYDKEEGTGGYRKVSTGTKETNLKQTWDQKSNREGSQEQSRWNETQRCDWWINVLHSETKYYTWCTTPNMCFISESINTVIWFEWFPLLILSGTMFNTLRIETIPIQINKTVGKQRGEKNASSLTLVLGEANRPQMPSRHEKAISGYDATRTNNRPAWANTNTSRWFYNNNNIRKEKDPRWGCVYPIRHIAKCKKHPPSGIWPRSSSL